MKIDICQVLVFRGFEGEGGEMYSFRHLPFINSQKYYFGTVNLSIP